MNSKKKNAKKGFLASVLTDNKKLNERNIVVICTYQIEMVVNSVHDPPERASKTTNGLGSNG